MKKFTVLFLMMIYMASVIGVTYSLHYCGGKFKEVCFTSDTEKNCCGTKERSRGCCSDKVVSAKCKDSHSPAVHSILPDLFYGIVHVVHFTFPVEKRTAIGYQTYVFSDASPPPIQGVPIYLMNRVFRV